MESNEQTELTNKIETDSQMESRMMLWGIEQKGKRLMDNSVVIEGGREYKGDKW